MRFAPVRLWLQVAFEVLRGEGQVEVGIGTDRAVQPQACRQRLPGLVLIPGRRYQALGWL
jgi:hypothetical protein